MDEMLTWFNGHAFCVVTLHRCRTSTSSSSRLGIIELCLHSDSGTVDCGRVSGRDKSTCFFVQRNCSGVLVRANRSLGPREIEPLRATGELQSALAHDYDYRRRANRLWRVCPKRRAILRISIVTLVMFSTLV